MIRLSHPTGTIEGELTITGSKSESNRWLILQQLYQGLGPINNLSNSDDTQILKSVFFHARFFDKNLPQIIDAGHAGTVMRFLTSYFALLPGAHIILTGSVRLQQRPVAPLVDALRKMGCSIKYLGNEGFPPLEIQGKTSYSDEILIDAGISSQFITALMLTATKLEKGLKINFLGELTSRAYVEMTKSQLESIGTKVEWLKNGIRIYPLNQITTQSINVESDWSSASYWFATAALSQYAEIRLNYFKEDSLQGDAVTVDIFRKYFGVNTVFHRGQIILSKITNFHISDQLTLDLNNAPDLAQTIAVTCAGLKIKTLLTGLKTLKIKETDRLVALQNELIKTGAISIITEDSLEIVSYENRDKIPCIETFDDHRMAMSFAALATKTPLQIVNPEVVSKSYPEFWKDCEKLGFQILH